MEFPYYRKTLPLTPGAITRRRHLYRPERNNRKTAVFVGLTFTILIILGTGVHNVRFFCRRSTQKEGLGQSLPGRHSVAVKPPPGIGIELGSSESLLDGGEGSQEENTAIAVSKEHTLVNDVADLTLFAEAGAENKLLGGVELSEVAGGEKVTDLRRGVAQKDWEEESEGLEEEEVSAKGIPAGGVVTGDEEARRAGAEEGISEDSGGVESERETEPKPRGKVVSQRVVPKKDANNAGAKKSPKRKSGHSGCDPHFATSAEALAEPLAEKRWFESFGLKFRTGGGEDGGFNGHQTWEEREESFQIQDPMTVHCGFMTPGEGPHPGFHLDPQDSDALSSCQIAVVSATFGASDAIHSISKSQVSDLSHRTVCFVLFLDAPSLAAIKKDRKPGVGKDGRIGIWRPVVVRPPLPYEDPRRTGKIPKLLAHRLFPRARYSIWIDAKLKLVQDPRAVLERFLWRTGAEFAISNHYDRHDVAEEVMQNKKLNKYDHTAIDDQYAQYVREGLDTFNASDPNRLLSSYVPEGSLIIREHTPMSNLFSCLWFNEVDRFTSRDQLSFAHTVLRLTGANPGKKFQLKMFLDCERRATAKLFKHRAEAGSTQRKRTAT